MKVVTAEQMRLIDRTSIEDYSIPDYLLMNNAGKSISDFIADKFSGKKIIIFCGRGNNGGDGFAAAFYLNNAGFEVNIFLAGYKEKVSPTSAMFVQMCEKTDITIVEVADDVKPEFYAEKNILIIDAVTGTGFEGTPSGTVLRFIEIINSSNCTVVAADISSGLPSDGEAPSGPAVYANYTITMGLPKISLVTYPGAEYSGNVYAVDIGFPGKLTCSSNIKVSLADDSMIKQLPFVLDTESYKGKRGHTLIVGGFCGMEGAALLTAEALFETGTGLATLLTDSEARKIAAGKIPELMTQALPELPDRKKITEIIDQGKYGTLIIGPGMGRDTFASEVFNVIIDNLEDTGVTKALIDGDGLYHLSLYLKKRKLPENIDFIITPHFVEASRLYGKTADEIKARRLFSCKEIASNTGAVCLLKGPGSIVSDGEYSFINTTGNPALGTAGSGDVLSGITGSFMNMDIPLIIAGSAAMYIHGLSADIFISENPQSAMKAGDIIKNIRGAVNVALQM